MPVPKWTIAQISIDTYNQQVLLGANRQQNGNNTSIALNYPLNTSGGEFLEDVEYYARNEAKKILKSLIDFL